MSWITITTAAVQSRLADAELDAARTAAVADGQADPLDEIISRVVKEVRGYVAANSSNTLGDGNTIPDECEDAALALIRYRLWSRLPLTMTEARTAEKNDAITFLSRVADGKVCVVAPETSASAQVTSIKPSVSARRRHFTRRDEDGI